MNICWKGKGSRGRQGVDLVLNQVDCDRGRKTGTDRPWLGVWHRASEGLFILSRLLSLGGRAKKVGAGVDGRCSSVGKQG